jgi:hypothetical protein
MARLVGVCLVLLFCVIRGSAQGPPPGSPQTPTTTINVNPVPGDNRSGPATAVAGSPAPSYGFWMTYGAMTAVLIFFIIGMLIGLHKWSLRDALMDDSASGGPKPSISRLIALMGFAVLISIYLGIGYSVIFRLLSGGTVGDLSGLGSFLLGAAALFAPYLANQIKGAAIGVANAQAAASASSSGSVTSISPKSVPGGGPQMLTASGIGLAQVQSALCTLENGSESPIASASVNVLNAGAVQVSVTMPAPTMAGTPYSSMLTLVTNTGQRIVAGQYTVT